MHRVDKVVIVGQGYVGLPLSVAAVEAGLTVVGLDTDDNRIRDLAAARSYVDDVSDDTMRRILASGRYLPTRDYSAAAGFDVAVITVPTPLRDGAPDLSYIRLSAQALAPHVVRGSTVILESTTYPGTTEEMLVPELEEGSSLTAGEDFHVAFSPERIDPGSRVFVLRNTPKVVGGLDAASLEAAMQFYSRFIDRVVPVSNPRVAEMTKLLENTFRHVNIALVNELAVFAHALGVDVWEAIDAASTKPFGFMRFTPGPGVGGHCLPVDPSYLSWRVKRETGRTFRFVELANDINDYMPDYVVDRLVEALNARAQSARGAQVLLVGVAYKKNTGDRRESPALRIIRRLNQLGSSVRYVDPFVSEFPGAERVDLTPDEVAKSDAIVIVTDHDGLDYAMIGAARAIVLDTRNRLAGKREHL